MQLDVVGRGVFVFDLEFKDQHESCFINTKRGDHVGLLNNKTCRSLRGLLDAETIQFEGVIHESEWKEKADIFAKDCGKVYLDIDIDIFGTMDLEDKVARGLSSLSLHLQHYHGPQR